MIKTARLSGHQDHPGTLHSHCIWFNDFLVIAFDLMANLMHTYVYRDHPQARMQLLYIKWMSFHLNNSKLNTYSKHLNISKLNTYMNIFKTFPPNVITREHWRRPSTVSRVVHQHWRTATQLLGFLAFPWHIPTDTFAIWNTLTTVSHSVIPRRLTNFRISTAFPWHIHIVY